MNKNGLNFVISGYYGHDNFGDEAILSTLIAVLRKNFENPYITVISNKPKKTGTTHGVDSVYKYDLFRILGKISSCDVFISGGGSLLQDKTSIKSLFYYLSLMFFAQKFNIKTFVYAQGIGPLKNKLSRLLTQKVLKKVDLITVRDKQSAKLLSAMGIDSTITADPVWAKEYLYIEKEENKLNVGIQLRKWESLDETRLNALADAVIENFKGANAVINLISLQSSRDTAVLKKLENILKSKDSGLNMRFLSDLTQEQVFSCISSLDYLIAMRYHAELAGLKYNVPVLALIYDPKVKNLAQEADIPYVPIKNMNFYSLDKAIKYMISDKDRIKEKLQGYSAKKAGQARENIVLLQKLMFKQENQY